MKKWGVLFLFLVGCMIHSSGKTRPYFNFKIDGTINIDSGKIYLNFYSDYILSEVKQIVAEIKNKKFSISGYIPESQGVFISVGNTYISSDFVIDKGTQTISINIDSVREVPKVRNVTMLQEYPVYQAFYKKVDAKKNLLDQRRESLYKLYNNELPDSIKLILDEEQKAIYNESDSTLLKYAVRNPNSKIAFWNLIRLLSWGYEPVFDSIYNTFSGILKNGYAGKTLNGRLKDSRQLSVGQMFPIFNCQNVGGENLSSRVFLQNKFILVDFWYSRCNPCRRQFAEMRDLYRQYSGCGFEIVGISVDKIKDKKEWEDVIVKEKLVWKQYWDKNGTGSQRYSIRAFPTNFLLDSTGRIIDKNISMGALSKFLSSHELLL